MRRDVFQAIADPTRREIIGLLARDNMTPNAVAENFGSSRQAISKHLKILTECGIITMIQQGRERYCHIHPESLGEVSDWLDGFRKMWEQRFDRLDALLERMQAPGKKSKR